jgi:Right handed beta helix region
LAKHIINLLMVCTLLAVLSHTSNVMALSGGNVIHAIDFVDSDQGRDDVAISQALKEIGDSRKTLVLAPGSWAIHQSVSIPENVHVELAYGATLNIDSGKTFHVEGPMDVSGLAQIFFGAGEVRFGSEFLDAVYPQWWGEIKGVDDTQTCQAALDSGATTIRFPKAVYAIDAVGDGAEGGRGIYPASNTKILFDPGSLLKVIPTDKNDYTAVNLKDVHNVIIDGASLKGDRDGHLGEGGEWGHGFRICGTSSNIQIINSRAEGFWGDGIYLGEGHVKDIYVFNSVFDNNRRNACSIISAENVLFKKCTFSNTHGTGPHKGVDIEPNTENDVIQNIVFEDCYSYNNRSAGFSLARDYKQNRPVSVTFRGCVSENDGTGFSIDQGPSETLGIVYINDCVSLNARETGFRCTSANLQFKIDGLYIVNPNQNNGTRPQFGSGFSVIGLGSPYKGKTKLAGNIDARNVYVYSTDGKAHYALYMENYLGDKGGFQNIDIELKSNMPSQKRFYKGAGPYRNFCKIDFSDGPVVEVSDDVAGEEMALYIGQTITNASAENDITLSLSDPRSVALDSEYTFELVRPHIINIDVNGTQVVPGDAKRYWSDEVGGRLTIRSDGENWHIVEQIGSWNYRK